MRTVEADGAVTVGRWYRHPQWVAVCLCLAVNAVMLGAVAANDPQYLVDYRVSDNPDARHYFILGRNIVTLGEFSRNTQPPYVPDMLRTPIYPLFVGALNAAGGPGLVYAAQGMLQAMTCWLLFLLVEPFVGRRSAMLASLLLALDPMLAISNLQAMSEPLFTCLVLWALVVAVPLLLKDPKEGATTGTALKAGALLALATLTRPAGLYLPMVLGLMLIARGWWHGHLRLALKTASVLVVAALIPVSAWIARNAAVFAVPRLSTADAIMTVYFAGAGGYQRHFGISLDEAQQRISQEFALPPPNVTNNHWTTTQSVAEMDRELRAASLPVLTKYPLDTLISSSLGIVKSSLSHNVAVLAGAMRRPWTPPSASAVLEGDIAGAFGRLLENHPLTVVVLFWTLAQTAIVTLLALAFVPIALVRPALQPFGWAVGPVLLYFVLTVGLVGAEAYWRSRTPHLPFLCALAAAAAIGLSRPQPAAQQVHT